MTEFFERVNALAASTHENGVAFALDNGRVAFMCHLSPDKARELGKLLIEASDAAFARMGVLTGEEAQSP